MRGTRCEAIGYFACSFSQLGCRMFRHAESHFRETCEADMSEFQMSNVLDPVLKTIAAEYEFLSAFVLCLYQSSKAR